MISTLIWAVALCICCFLLSNPHITIEHKGETQGEGLTQEDLDKAYEDAEKDPAPSFEAVIDAINREFGGINDDQ